ncbi:MAG: hypothetical protein QNJ72_10080 [Pleurocapsa sp. MO_226.B13]|nr:hypothetical protein [Pleurocapsa sp. MO_226.B13]
MTTIVRHKRTGNEYILLGINGEESKTNPSRFINELFTQEKSEVSFSATVCDVRGNLFLAYIDELMVVEIDGKKPADLLPEPELESTPNNSYPQQTSDFDEEELEDEDFEKEEVNRDRVEAIKSEPPSPSQGTSSQSDFDDDDEDWI